MRQPARVVPLVAVFVLAACGSPRDSAGPRSSATAATPGAGQSSAAAATTRGSGIATDQPCTRSVVLARDVFTIPIQLQDLERMIPSVADVPGLVGFEDDQFTHGYHDNAELNTIVPNPPSTCDDLERLGRITGFGIGYARPNDSSRQVLFAVHLFGDEAGATAWPDAFFGPLAAAVGTPGGPTSFTMTRPQGLPEGTIVAEHVGPDGVRTWASTTRGRIVGWVIDLHPEGKPTVDIAAAVGVLARRIDAAVDATTGDRPGADAAHVLSATLPRSSYGRRGESLVWDSFFGGCADAIERGLVAGDQARIDAQRFGRLSGCTAMYSPAGGTGPDGTVRVFSAVSMYRDPQGASAAMAAVIAQDEALGGIRFAVPDLGDEARGLVIPDVNAGDLTYRSTRITLRHGFSVGGVTIHSTAGDDVTRELIERAVELDARMTEFLGP
jgi:hypothetical protein